jgi:nitrate reductase gamma subunit
MGILFSLLAVIALMAIAYSGTRFANMQFLFGVVIPYLAGITFIGGVIYRVMKWAGSPVPFRITTTTGQQKSLPWIKQGRFENPSDTAGVIGRMLLEILLFHSLFRNLKMELNNGERIIYKSDKWLWLAGLAFHWAFLIILIRHFRFFAGYVPSCVRLLESLDSWLQVGLPRFYITDMIILMAVTYLLIRRFVIPQVRYISLLSDYFPLFLILGIAITGILMRYVIRVDITGVKTLTLGLAAFNPSVPEGLGVIFYIHIFLVSILFAYLPFSKLIHSAGVFLSPTRNLSNNSRMERHINPWNYPVKIHTYEEYENEFREKMKKAGLPVEKG